MKINILCLILAVMAASTGLFSGNAQPGSPDFYPTAANPIGWRGDGSGQYPGATPPVAWGQRFKQLGDLRCAAEIPRDNSKTGGEPAVLGFFTEWLATGPIKVEDPVAAIKEPVPGESSMTPVSGDKLGDSVWQSVKVEDSFIDVTRIFGKMTKDQAAYVQACLYSGKAQSI